MTNFDLDASELITDKNQLHAKEVEETRTIANVMIHVERVIGSICQKFTIFENGSLPIDMLRTNNNGTSLYDEIVTVFCALVNHYGSMIK